MPSDEGLESVLIKIHSYNTFLQNQLEKTDSSIIT